MAANHKRKVDNGNRQFNDDWTVQYCFVQQHTNVICLLCHSTVAVAKVSNIKHHYETRHRDFHNVVGDDQTAQIESLRHSLNRQQNIFSKQSADFSVACEVSYEISLMIAKSGPPFTDADFVKQCMITVSSSQAADGGFESHDSSMKNFTPLSRRDKTACRQSCQLCLLLFGCRQVD
ncbi:hypothetical protein ACJMK2_034732 [Sinanodonta woodiana]|uniref:SPIN-DOC-like zinc-finger domain-containing protein n=1 Tax=Sinanodonta woodiana TaxID=1069815 RepID=A0ABD3WWM2_SINWO